MDLLSSIAVVLLLFSAAAGDVSLSGQWISGDSVFNHQNVFQIENGEENDLTVYRLTDVSFDSFSPNNNVNSWETGKLFGNNTYFILRTDNANVFVGHLENNTLITWDKLPPWKRVSSITRVHVIFMNHLDVGYDGIWPDTGFINNVLNEYFTVYFPRAISLASGINHWKPKLSFIYTTHPWLVSLYLDCPPNMVLNGIKLSCPSKDEVDTMISAIKSGYITMHAGPMNMQYGMMNSDTVVASIQLAQRIYQQLGMDYTPGVLSLRDVPGLTRNSLTALAYAGVKAITVGVNPSTSPPAVPQLFKWQADLSVLGMWHKGGYPFNPGSTLTNAGGLSYNDCLIMPEQQAALAFAFRKDNSGPPMSFSEIEENFNLLQEQFPGADIFASTLDRFYDEVLSMVTDIPTVTSEIGDTWLQGVQSDPRKTAEYRSMQKAYSDCVAASACMDQDPRVFNATRFMMKLAEHTWGLNGVDDSRYWSNEEFNKVKDSKNFQNAINSWIEQRAFVNYTLEALGDHPLAQMMSDELETTKAKLPPLGECDGLPFTNPVYDFTVNDTKIHVEFDTHRGPLSALQVSDTGEWLLKNTLFGDIVYHTYNESDFMHFASEYNYYGNAGFDKPNSTIAHPESKVWYTKPTYFYYCHPATFIVSMEMEDAATVHSYYGAPSQIWMNYTFINYDSLVMELQLMNKTPTRLGEATMLNFHLPSPVSDNVMVLYDLSNEASVFDVLLNGSQLQHGGFGVRTDSFTIYNHHTQVICPIPYPEGQATPFAAPLTPLDHVIGVAFNIHNNIWNTNYPLWYPFIDEDDDFKAVFTAKLTPPK